jgi:hypothetical protein
MEGTLMPTTAVCADCEIAYPENLLAPYFEGDGRYTPLCGICALVRINIAHKTRFKAFVGELAETKRKQALAFRAQMETK